MQAVVWQALQWNINLYRYWPDDSRAIVANPSALWENHRPAAGTLFRNRSHQEARAEDELILCVRPKNILGPLWIEVEHTFRRSVAKCLRIRSDERTDPHHNFEARLLEKFNHLLRIVKAGFPESPVAVCFIDSQNARLETVTIRLFRPNIPTFRRN